VPRISPGVAASAVPESSFLRTLKLAGARVATDGRMAHPAEIEISRGRIQSLDSSPLDRQRARSGGALTVDLNGYMVLPGLINAHDHLEFNLFPRMGKGPHANAEQWAQHIYHPDQSPVRELRELPKSVRLWWGAIKNLLSGVTTVCHHNPYQPEVFEEGFPVRVIRRFGWAHSLALEKNVAGAFLATPPDDPFVIHLGEGTDAGSREEIFALDRLGALDSRTVIVHGVGLDAAGHALIRKRRAGLVWCPTSNLFTLGRTLAHEVVEHNPRVALGNDSALTAEGDLLDELRAAYRHTDLPAEELYSMVTVRAAELLRLREGEGAIGVGKVADLIAIRDSGMPPAQVLLGASFCSIELVLLGGQPALLSPAMAERWPPELREGLNSLCVEDEVRWVRGPVTSLLEQAAEKLGSDLRLAGKRIGAG
jgi:cytosine/adenosine deaminase-related metal-dependent hydrolase